MSPGKTPSPVLLFLVVQLAIRGILAEGRWIESPVLVKSEFSSHFASHFDKPPLYHLLIDMDFPKKLSFGQQTDLENTITRDEFKKEFWDCEMDKSPGPDGFTFGFYRIYWTLIENGMVEAVLYFFQYGKFPKDTQLKNFSFKEASSKETLSLSFLVYFDHGKPLYLGAKSGRRRAPRGGSEEPQFTQLLKNMEGIWSLEGCGEFSVASVRKMLDDSSLPVVSSKTRWIHAVPIKVNIHAWKVRLDNLPTRLNISKRVESFSHLLFSCHLARSLMLKVARWWDSEVIALNSYAEWLTWFHNIRLRSKLKEILQGTCYVMWWAIWNFRNQVVFGANLPRLDLIFDDIVHLSFSWCSNRCNLKMDWNSWLKCPSSIHL
ncbi:hypothetical protein Tco_0339649 [Tanacetum coccineum]